MDSIHTLVIREIATALAGRREVSTGTVTSYNPTDHTARVRLQPEGDDSGDLHVCITWNGARGPLEQGMSCLVAWDKGEPVAVIGSWYDQQHPAPTAAFGFPDDVHVLGSLTMAGLLTPAVVVNLPTAGAQYAHAIVALKPASGVDSTPYYCQVTRAGGYQWRRAVPDTFNVLDFWADPTGGNISATTAAILAARTAAQNAGGGIVFFPAGTYRLNAAIGTTVPGIVFRGESRSATTIIQTANTDIFDLNADHCIVENLTLDTLTNNCAGACVASPANYCTIRDLIVKGGNNGLSYAIFFAGPLSAVDGNLATYAVGNSAENIVLTDTLNGDGFSWSFQWQSTIRNIVHYGSRLSVYKCSDMTIEGYRYTANPAVPAGSRNGFYLTEPCTNIAIRDFLCQNGNPVVGVGTTNAISGIIIDGLSLSAGHTLTIADSTGVVIRHSLFPTNAFIGLLPTTAITNLRVENCQVAQIEIGPNAPSTVTIDAVYRDNTYLAVTGSQLAVAHSFVQASGTVTHNGDVVGGIAHNATGLIYPAAISNTTIRGVRGYNPVGSVTTPAFPATSSGTNNYIQNTTGVDVQVVINPNAATITHVYLSPASNGTGRVDLGATATQFVLQAGQWMAAAFTGGPPTHVWYGL